MDFLEATTDQGHCISSIAVSDAERRSVLAAYQKKGYKVKYSKIDF